MSWIQSIPPEEAAGELQDVYGHIRQRSSRASVSRIWQALGLDPAGLGAAHRLHRLLVREPGPLTEVQVQLIAVVVSALNGCGYCVAHAGPRLADALGDETLARAVAMDYRTANLPARDRVLLDHAVALTCEPAERKLEDLERLREYGFDDARIVRATEVTAWYNYANRLVSALGVTLEPEVAPWAFGGQR